MLTPRRSNRLAGLDPDMHPLAYYNINKQVPECESVEDVIPESGSGTTLDVCSELTMIFTATAFFAWLFFSNMPPSSHFHTF